MTDSSRKHLKSNPPERIVYIMSKNSQVKEYFKELRNKDTVTIQDIDKIGEFFFEFIQISQEQFEASREISNFKQKIPHQVLSLENISKPLALSNLIPVPLQKWKISDEDFSGYLKTTSDHEYKQIVSAKYGTTLGFLKYKYWIPDTDLEMLQVIKEKYQHADSDFPYSDKQAKRLALKLDKFLDERLHSESQIGLLHLYETVSKSKAEARGMALMKIFPFSSQYQTFAESIENTDTSYEDLIIRAKSFKTEEVKFNKPFVSIIVADEDDFKDTALRALNGALRQMKIVDARKAKIDIKPKTIEGIRNIKQIVEADL